MSRKYRTHFPHAMYHVIMRGNNKQNIFLDDIDHQAFLNFIKESMEKFYYKIHAYCLMKNHIHLALEVVDIPLHRIIQNIAQRYACWFNRRYKCIGHLFQGRYKAILIQDEQYMLELCRYIHLNPLRAKIVNNLEQYPWNSHLAYLKYINIPWITMDLVLGLINSLENNVEDNDKQIEAYKNFIFDSEHVFRPFLEMMADGKIVCNDQLVTSHNNAFKQEIQKISLEKIIEVVCRNSLLNTQDIFIANKNWRCAEARAIITLCVQEFGEISLTDLSIFYQRDLTTLSNAVKRLMIKQRSKIILKEKITKIMTELRMLNK